MILEVQGIFAGRWVKLKYRIDKKVIENKITNDESFNFKDAEDYRLNHTFEDNLELLKRYPDDIEMVEGGRLDLIVRTSPEVLFDLSDYRLQWDNLTLLERLIQFLGDINKYPKTKDYVEMAISINNINDALNILNFKAE